MSQIRRTLRAAPTMLRIGVAETVAYRGEFIVWLLVTTMPLVMLGLWKKVTDEGAFQGFTSEAMVAYYLCSLIVRNTTGSWVGWQISEEIRLGTMSMRLLRPVHPYFAFAFQHIAAIPFRLAVALPFTIILLVSSGGSAITTNVTQLLLLVPSLALAWLINFNLILTLGSVAFFATKTMALMNLYFGLFSLLSGYLLPIALLPDPLRIPAEWLPFRFGLSAPIELLVYNLDTAQALTIVGMQAAWGAVTLTGAFLLWRAGVRRFESVGA